MSFTLEFVQLLTLAFDTLSWHAVRGSHPLTSDLVVHCLGLGLAVLALPVTMVPLNPLFVNLAFRVRGFLRLSFLRDYGFGNSNRVCPSSIYAVFVYAILYLSSHSLLDAVRV